MAFRIIKPEDGITCRLPTDRITIVGFTDDHIGANDHHAERFKQKIERVKKEKNTFWFCNGDVMEFIPPNYKISQRGQYEENDDQFLECVELLEPIADKCLWMRGGNHDSGRSTKIMGFDVVRILAERLKVPFYDGPGFSRVVCTENKSKKNFLLMATGHGSSGAANGDLELARMKQIYTGADIFFLGHNHQLYAKPVDALGFVSDGEHLLRQWYVRGGSSLLYAGYARDKFLPVIRTGWAEMSLTEAGAVHCTTTI